MAWEPRRHLPLLVGFSLVVAAVGLVTPWWTVEIQGSTVTEAAPFSPGSAARGQADVDEAAVTAVGILDLVGLLGLAGGLALWFRGKDEDLGELAKASWLWLGGGGFLLVAALTAVVTWPGGDVGFWDSSSGGPISLEAAASVGWYLTVLAGGVASIAGLAWLTGDQGQG